MKIIYMLFLVLGFVVGAWAGEDGVGARLWVEGRVTPEQPFKAKVVAAGGVSPWSGETVLYLREDGEGGRFLRVRIGFATGEGVRYVVIKDKKMFDGIVGKLRGHGAAVFIDPVDVSRFVWASPLGGVGRIFGDEDLVKMAYVPASKDAEGNIPKR